MTNTPDVLSECTADIAMTLMLMVARRAGEGERELRDGRWTGWRPTHMIGTKVSGATLGIIGFGRIGQAMAQRAHFGFGMKIIVQNRSAVPAEVLARYNAVQVPTIEELLPQCDFVSLHCPGGVANRHLINSRRLDLMRPGAFLINTARGEVVDEHALAQALWFGTIGGAANLKSHANFWILTTSFSCRILALPPAKRVRLWAFASWKTCPISLRVASRATG
ncbi:MAG: hypothetical protein RI979_2444 [Pseudomonadota bacterium]